MITDPRSIRAREEAAAALADLTGARAGATLAELRALIADQVEAARRLAGTATARAARRRALVRGMAEAIVTFADLTGSCSERDLARLFTAAEIARLRGDALRLARALRPAYAEAA